MSRGPLRALALCVPLALASAADAAPIQEQNAQPAGAVAPAATAPTAPLDPEQQLLRVRRIFVESFGDDPISRQTQAMVVDSLTKSKRFIVTENLDRADAILKGTAVEKRSQELHVFSESGDVSRAVAGSRSTYSEHSSGSVSGRVVNGTGTVHGSSSGSAHGESSGYAAATGVGIDDSQATTETIDDARISVRLVSPDGDVIWSTTQESRGAKYKGASADAADKVAKQLLRDVDRLERKAP